MVHHDFGEHVAEVGRHRKIGPFVSLSRGKPRPFAVDAAAVNAAADRHHGVAVPVVRAAMAVLADSPPELRHRQHDGVFHAIAEVDNQSRDAAAEIIEPCGELTLRGSLVDLGIPFAEVGESDLVADVRLRELGCLLERLPEGGAGIVGAACRPIVGRIRPLNILMASNASRPVLFSTRSAEDEN